MRRPDPGATPAAAARSIGVRAWPVLVVVVAAHVFLRPQPWRFDWTWALLQFAFVTTMLAPLIAGFAAVDGSRLAAAGPLVTSTGRGVAALTWQAVGSWGWGVVAYGVGLVIVAVRVVPTGAPAPSVWGVVSATVPPLVMLFAAAAVGGAVGYRLGRWYGAPIAAVGTYVAIVAGFLAQHEVLVRVGGANEEVLGLTVRAGYTGRQLIWFGVLAAAAVVVGSRRFPSAPAVFPAAPEIAVLATVAVLAAVAATAPTMFALSSARLACRGTDPEVCLSPAYVRFEGAVRERFAPALRLWAEIDGPPVQRLSMGVVGAPRPGDPVRLPADLVAGSGSPSAAISQVYNAGIAGCSHRIDTSDELVGWSLVAWLHDQADGDPTSRLGSSADPWFGLPAAEQTAWATGELRRVLAFCAR